MPSDPYYRNCRDCGQRILLVRLDTGKFVACEPDARTSVLVYSLRKKNEYEQRGRLISSYLRHSCPDA